MIYHLEVKNGLDLPLQGDLLASIFFLLFIQANSSLDEFMHIVKCQGKNVRVMLSPSPSYNGPIDE